MHYFPLLTLGFDFIKPGNEGDVRRIWAMRVITLKEKGEGKTIKKLLKEKRRKRKEKIGEEKKLSSSTEISTPA